MDAGSHCDSESHGYRDTYTDSDCHVYAHTYSDTGTHDYSYQAAYSRADTQGTDGAGCLRHPV